MLFLWMYAVFTKQPNYAWITWYNILSNDFESKARSLLSVDGFDSGEHPWSRVDAERAATKLRLIIQAKLQLIGHLVVEGGVCVHSMHL